MRYPDGGGLTAEGRARREKVRLQAAQMFEQGTEPEPEQVARCLRVSAKSAYQWRRCWRAGGEAALACKGPGGNACKLDGAQLARLRADYAGLIAAAPVTGAGQRPSSGPACHQGHARWTVTIGRAMCCCREVRIGSPSASSIASAR